MRQLIDRWKAPTPATWKKVQRVSAALAAMCMALAANDSFPKWLSITGTIAGSITAFITQFTKENDNSAQDN